MPARINLAKLDSTELSDHGRTYSMGRNEKTVEVELANGSLKQYVKAVKKTFSMTWTKLPSLSSQTSDLKAGRDELLALCHNGNSHVLILRDAVSGADFTYNVFVKGYTEAIWRRDYIGNVYYYDITVDFVER